MRTNALRAVATSLIAVIGASPGPPATQPVADPALGVARYTQLDWLWKPASGAPPLATIRPAPDQPAIPELKTGLTAAQIDAGGKILPIAREDALAPNAVIEESISGPGVVRAIYVAVPDRIDPLDAHALYRCAIRIAVDGAKEPQIELPLSVFFGGGSGRPEVNMLVAGGNRSVDVPLPERRAGSEFCYMLLPIPFLDGCHIELLNAGSQPINLLLYARVAIGGETKDGLRLYARYRREFPVQRRNWTIAQLRGKGSLVGLTRLIDAPRDAWTDVGSTVIELEGARRRDAGFAAASLPPPHDGAAGPLEFLAASRAYGSVVGVEWRIADPLEFTKAAKLTIPVSAPSDDEATAPWIGAALWWYAAPGCTHDFPRLRVEDLQPPPLRLADAIEIEGRTASPDARRVVAKEARGVEYSGDAAVSIAPEKDIAIDVPFLATRDIELKIRVNPRQDFGTMTAVSARGHRGEATFDRRTSGIYTLGRWGLTPGANTVTIRTTRGAVLDCWLTPEVAKP